MNKNISILGCGWLGLPLAISLINNQYTVKGSTTNVDKIKILSDSEIDPYLVQLHNLPKVNESNFWQSDILLVNVPPSLKKQSSLTYLSQMKNLAYVVEASNIQQVIFISSTSVYPERNKTFTNINEVDESLPLLQSERLFTASKKFTTTVIRFGGLIGPGRHPARFFAGKTNIPNGNAPVNLIHLNDCIGIIKSLLDQKKFGRTYHVASPSHPSRKEFYTTAAQQAGLALPQFTNELTSWKIIDPELLVQLLNYRFLHPDLLALVQ